MNTYSTISEAMQSKNPVIVNTKEVKFNGKDRKWHRVQKANGKKLYMIVEYENGQFSSPVTY